MISHSVSPSRKRPHDKLDVKLDQSVKSRYVLVHITKLSSDGESDWYRGGISDIKTFG